MSAIFKRFMVQNPEVVHRLSLNESEIKIVRFISENPECVSKDVADHLDTSLESACTRLRILITKGYLMRSDIGDPTGGIMYVYRLHNDLTLGE